MSDTRFPNAGVIRKRQLKRNFSDKEIVSGFSKPKSKFKTQRKVKHATAQDRISAAQRIEHNKKSTKPKPVMITTKALDASARKYFGDTHSVNPRTPTTKQAAGASRFKRQFGKGVASGMGIPTRRERKMF